MKVLLAIPLIFMLAACGSGEDARPLTDAEHVQSIIRRTAAYASPADGAYSRAMDAMESIKTGTPIDQAVAAMRENARAIDRSVTQLASLAVNDCPNVQDTTAREALDTGVRGLYAVNKIRHGFIVDAAAAIDSKSPVLMKAVISRHGDSLKNIESGALMALMQLSAAKHAVGLPMELPEFQQ